MAGETHICRDGESEKERGEREERGRMHSEESSERGGRKKSSGIGRGRKNRIRKRRKSSLEIVVKPLSHKDITSMTLRCIIQHDILKVPELPSSDFPGTKPTTHKPFGKLNYILV